MKVKDVLKRHLFTVKPNDNIKKAMQLLCYNKISGLPVIDDDNKLIGMISEKDILKAMYLSPQEYHEYGYAAYNDERYKDIMYNKVSTIMSSTLITVNSDAAILKVASLMLLNKVRRVAVVDKEGKLIDVISQGDIHLAIFNKYLDDNN
ncbi:MAG: CBS domain-containing protein [Clostridiales bacterium]